MAENPPSETSRASGELSRFFRGVNEIILVVDEERVVVAASDLAQRTLGINLDGSHKVPVDDFFPRVYLDAIFSRVRLEKVNDKPLTFPVKDASGKEIILETRFNWSRLGEKDVLILSCRDISWYTDAISGLGERENRYRTIFHESPLGFVHVNSDGYVTDCNSAFLGIFGFDRSEAIGVCLAEENNLQIYQRFKIAAMDALIGVSSRHESQFQAQDGGQARWVRVSFSPVRTDDQIFLGAIGIVEDITEAKRAIEEISFVSSHDALTGLYNRAACEKALAALDKQEHLPLSLIFADLNCLKLANDAFGHEEGDTLLRAAAGILIENVTHNDSAYRLGGDEFLMILPNTDLSAAVSRSKSIADTCAVWKTGGLVRVSVALGCATKYFVEQDLNNVMKASEDEMYANKLHYGKKTRKTILAELEKRLHGMMGGAMGKRCRSMMLWGEWAIANMSPKLDPDEFRLLCRYHDIGVLASPGELDIIRVDQYRNKVAPPMQHMAAGYRIARSIAELTPAAENILAHHEWWDGMGYPNQLRGDEIPYASRLISIFDAVEGMVTLASEGDIVTLDDAVKSVELCAGRQFDPDLVGEFTEKLAKTPPEFI
ncbi:MAG: diguanylate cyclase [Synergistaceae bacterium]|jgi:diguanylate cyclase (GGDEF)-like protein/PAS domain S-box-containing protein|nr:diguanylate cyclase [Synergistaceae bacterium]